MRIERPLVPSEGMRHVLRLIAVVRDAALARGEIAVVADATPAGPGTLDIGPLAEIEAELGTALHDDVLIVFAARIPMLTTATALAIDRVLDRLGEAHPHDGWVSIAWVSERPFEARRDRSHGGDLYDLYVPVPARAESVVAAGGFFETPFAFPEWVEDQLRPELSERSDWLDLRGRLGAVTDLPTFALAGRGAAMPLTTRRVIHDKFGVGTVIRVLEGGSRLVISFADVERTLLARFVRDV
jgi:hypothetical protein